MGQVIRAVPSQSLRLARKAGSTDSPGGTWVGSRYSAGKPQAAVHAYPATPLVFGTEMTAKQVQGPRRDSIGL